MGQHTNIIRAACDAIDASQVSAVDCLGGTQQTATIIPGTDLSRWHDRRLYYTRQDSGAPDGSVIYLGNSHIEGMPITDGLNWGIGGEDMRMLFNRLECSVIHRAGCVVLMSGTVDMGEIAYYLDYPNMVVTVKLIYDKLAAWITGKWVLCTMAPVVESMQPLFNNAAMAEVNAHILTLARTGVAVADVAGVLSDPNGSLRSDCHVGDGLHLNAYGYQRARPVIVAARESL